MQTKHSLPNLDSLSNDISKNVGDTCMKIVRHMASLIALFFLAWTLCVGDSAIADTVYQDSGAALNLSVRHSYHEMATQFKAKLEFGRRRLGLRPDPSDDGKAVGTEQTNDANAVGTESQPTKRSRPFLVNFSDGAVYHANFCGQGIDYFELLDADDQNAIWGEDWANNSSTFQCGAFNVALMQAAARKREQMIGHYLIAHAGRTPWDIKTKAVSETARGVRLWMNFAHGPNWSSHEGGPTWRSHLWHHRPELWTANAVAVKLKASDNNDQPEATNATASSALKAAAIEGISLADRELLDRSHNPWVYPAGIREQLLTPLRSAKLSPSLICDTPLIDAVELCCEQGVLLALSNHTLQPLDRVELRLKTDKLVTHVESVRLGPIPFDRLDGGLIRIALALAASDFVTVSTPANAPEKGLQIGKLRVGKVLFLGNSITLHGPAPKIGWTGNWGMAASAEDKDFVHVLTSHIAKAAGGKPQIKVKNIADFERNLTAYKLPDELREELAFEADIIVIALGENAASPKTDEAKAEFESAFTNLFAELKKHGQPTIFVRSQFWQDADKDKLMKKTCEAAGGTFLDISKLGFDEANYARAERKIDHVGVAGHPGDKGMQALADALWQAIQKQSAIE